MSLYIKLRTNGVPNALINHIVFACELVIVLCYIRKRGIDHIHVSDSWFISYINYPSIIIWWGHIWLTRITPTALNKLWRLKSPAVWLFATATEQYQFQLRGIHWLSLQPTLKGWENMQCISNWSRQGLSKSSGKANTAIHTSHKICTRVNLALLWLLCAYFAGRSLPRHWGNQSYDLASASEVTSLEKCGYYCSANNYIYPHIKCCLEMGQ